MNVLITGGCGFLGSNLANRALQQKGRITVLDNLSRTGSEDNLKWLQSQGAFEFIQGATTDRELVESIVRNTMFDAVFHLAGQVAMTTSIENPWLDFQTNTVGTFIVLDALRKFSPETAIFYSSTNKVYGDLEQFTYNETDTRYVCREYPDGFPENIQLDFHSPYGCSKGAADQYMLDFHRIFGLKTVVFRHSSMYGGRQYATADQGWIGWFCEKAVELARNPETPPFTISGNGKQVRDILHADDIVRLYFSALENIDRIAGEAFNIGGGIDQSLSLLELFQFLNAELNIKMKYTRLPPRRSDQKVFVADIAKISAATGWKPQVSSREGIRRMVEWIRKIS